MPGASLDMEKTPICICCAHMLINVGEVTPDPSKLYRQIWRIKSFQPVHHMKDGDHQKPWIHPFKGKVVNVVSLSHQNHGATIITTVVVSS